MNAAQILCLICHRPLTAEEWDACEKDPICERCMDEDRTPVEDQIDEADYRFGKDR